MTHCMLLASLCLLAEPEWISGSASVSLEECGAPYVGTAFGLESRPRQATLDLAVCGWHELEVNGRRVDDSVLSPATCQPDQRVSEISYDVTLALGAGTNTISILLGNGWWSQLTGEVWGFGHAPWHYRADSTKGHVCDFGIFGAKWVPRVLAENGYADDAWKIFTQRRHPGYQWWLDQGEDTLWETFGGEASHNHIMFGDVSAWAYEYIAGIRIVEPGFRKIRFIPHRPPGVDSFEARHKTPYGEIRAGWRMGSDGKPSFFCEVPPGVEIDAEPDA